MACHHHNSHRTQQPPATGLARPIAAVPRLLAVPGLPTSSRLPAVRR
jgi:hypothetical protein